MGLIPRSSGVPELVPADVGQLAVAAALPDAAVAAVARREQGAARPPHGRRRRRRLEARLPGALQAAALLAERAGRQFNGEKKWICFGMKNLASFCMIFSALVWTCHSIKMVSQGVFKSKNSIKN